MSQLVEIQAGDICWRVLPECRDLLFGPEGLRLERWLQSGQARIIKHGPHRTVYHVQLPGLDFHLKHYRLMDARAWLRQLLRPGKARREFRQTLAVAARQVPTVTPLGLGEPRRGSGPGDCFLITRTLPEVEPLTTFIETTLPRFAPARQTRIRQDLARELGGLLARMHEAGIFHYDLHAGNLLLRLEAGDRLRLYLIDLLAIHLGAPLSWADRQANLVVLNRWFVLCATRADRLRFWRAYCRERGGRGKGEGRRDEEFGCPGFPLSPSPFPLSCGGIRRSPLLFHFLAKELERLTWKSNQRFWHHRDRRCLESNRYYQQLHSAAALGYAVRDLDPATLAILLDDPDEPFRRPGVVLLKDSPSSTVAEFEMPTAGASRRVIYKRFRVKTWTDPWLALLRKSPAVRSWVFGHGFRERFLPTARPLLVLHRRRGGLCHEGYLLTEKIPRAMELQAFVSSLAGLEPAVRRAVLRSRIDQVARLVRDLHRRNLSHRDLKAANILVKTEGREERGKGEEIVEDFSKMERTKTIQSSPFPLLPSPSACSSPSTFLIDLVGVSRHRKLRRSRRVQNIARLHASFCRNPALTRTDKVRFLRCYLQWGLFGRGGWKRWWREIAQATQAKILRNARSGRPLC